MLQQWRTRLWARQSGVWIPGGARGSSLLQNIPTSSAAHPASQSVGTSTHSQGCSSDHSSPFSSKFKNECSHTSTPLYAFTVWRGTPLPLPFYHYTILSGCFHPSDDLTLRHIWQITCLIFVQPLAMLVGWPMLHHTTTLLLHESAVSCPTLILIQFVIKAVFYWYCVRWRSSCLCTCHSSTRGRWRHSSTHSSLQ